MSRYELAFTDPVDLQKRIDEYFRICDESKRELKLKNGDIKVRYEIPYSVIGLCNHLKVHKDTYYSYLMRKSKSRRSSFAENQAGPYLPCAQDPTNRGCKRIFLMPTTALFPFQLSWIRLACSKSRSKTRPEAILKCAEEWTLDLKKN